MIMNYSITARPSSAEWPHMQAMTVYLLARVSPWPKLLLIVISKVSVLFVDTDAFQTAVLTCLENAMS